MKDEKGEGGRMKDDREGSATSASSFILYPSSFYQVTFVTEGQERTLQVAETEYLLDAANNAGLNLPVSCLQGWCTTCARKVLEGKVDQSEALRVFRADEEAGFVLLCSAYPRSN